MLLQTNLFNTKYNKITFIKYNFSPFKTGLKIRNLHFLSIGLHKFSIWTVFFVIYKLGNWRVLTQVQLPDRIFFLLKMV